MSKPLTVGSLFAGIGGLELGLERAGMEVKWQVEIDDYATKVLEKHWPHVARWRDITTFPPNGRRDWSVDIICGGFPCQDISYAGKGAGLDGERSGLFYEAIRVVGLIKPRFVLLENVAALLNRGLSDVLGTLASIGYSAEWHCLQAADVGAPHIRDRIFIIARADRKRSAAGATDSPAREKGIPAIFDDYCSDITNANGEGSNTNSKRLPKRQGCKTTRTLPAVTRGTWWDTEPDLGRVANGVPKRVDRLRCLGNAVVPQVAEVFGRYIVELNERT